MDKVQFSSAYGCYGDLDQLRQIRSRYQNSIMIAQKYFEEVRQNNGGIPEDVIDIYGETTILSHIGRPEYSNRNLVLEAAIFRDLYVTNFGFVAITKALLSALARYIGDRKVLSVMSGSCTLEWHLENIGIDITCSDNKSWEGEFFKNIMPVKTFITGDAVDVVREHGKKYDLVLMSWPPYQDKSAAKVLSTMREVNQTCKMIYIGEELGGNCANDEFFDLAEAGEVDGKEEERFDLVRDAHTAFFGVHDRANLIC